MGRSVLSCAQSEDCLNLSISTTDRSGRRPVMVWIHGGAYVTGGGELPWYNPMKLAMEGNVVVVSITYRLGVFGYLWSGDQSIRNLGMLDQLAALQWVTDNIDRFGGDPEAVTVFGQSAGGHSIVAMLEHCGKNRPFKRAIIQSAPLSARLTRSDAESFADAFYRALKEDANCASVDAMLLAQRQALSSFKSSMPIGPVLEATNIERDGLDVMVGWARQDASPFVALGSKAAEGTSARSRLLAKMATWHLSRAKFAEPSKVFARMTPHGAKTYAYRLDWQPENSNYGACHCIDLPLLLGDEVAWRGAPMLGTTAWQVVEQLGRRVRSTWTAFAKTGDPSTEDGWNWQPFQDHTSGRITRLDV